ncbi:MAG TPA: hypothetical protein VFP40_07685 [Terriglobales bacterium]|nr:hypothetical protein [Terriglobales bacterium]
MKGYRFYLAILFVAVSSLAIAQVTGNQPGTGPAQGSTTPSTPGKGAAMASSAAIKILSPTIGEEVKDTSVTLRFQLVNAGMAPDPSPTYRVQLDSRDPVETSSTEQSFTGLQPGDHVIAVDLVDANHTPVGGSHTEVHFKSGDGTEKPKAAGQTSSLYPPLVRTAALPLPSEKELPSAGGELPLISMVGFGVLIGGIISALKTRK